MAEITNAKARRLSAPTVTAAEEDVLDGAVSHRLTFLLHRVVSMLIDGTAPYFRSLGLSIPAARALSRLLETGGEQTVGSLADSTAIDLSTLSHILRRLEAQGLVTRTRQARDNRVVFAALTEEGRRIAQLGRDASLRDEAILLGDMSIKEAALLKQMLIRVYRNARSGFAD
jgi:MarR family transcriptional regulator, organic hydroperoxide resistance regulator